LGKIFGGHHRYFLATYERNEPQIKKKENHIFISMTEHDTRSSKVTLFLGVPIKIFH
jgi:hypothetical protein